MKIKGCELINLPQISDPRGNLTFIESSKQIPFDIQRVYYLYDIPGGSMRGGHAHLKLEQLIISVHGSFDVILDDGTNKEIVSLNRAYQGLKIKNFIWRELINFSSGSICLVLANMPYSEDDYIRNYDEFLKLVSK